MQSPGARILAVALAASRQELVYLEPAIVELEKIIAHNDAMWRQLGR